MTIWAKGEPMTYRCSQCDQIFLLPEDRGPKDAATELWAAFQDHLQKCMPRQQRTELVWLR